MERLSNSSTKWITCYLSSHDNDLPSNWYTEFNTDNFGDFVTLNSIKAISFNITKLSTRNSITAAMNPSPTSSHSDNNEKVGRKIYCHRQI